MKTLLFGTVGVLALAIAPAIAPALAQPAPPTPPGVAPGTAPPLPRLAPAAPRPAMQMRMRVMSDRVMTRDEVIRHVHELFAKLDTNHDGFVTREELEAFHPKFARVAEMRGEMAGRDGGLAKRDGATAVHFPGHRMAIPDRARIFDKLDTNHDGVISRQEFMAAKTELHERRTMIIERDAASSPAAGPAPGQPEPMMRMHAMRSMDGHGGMAMHAGMRFGGHLFEMADVNRDGRVSLQEAEAAALAHFDRADLNHDGKITPEEREQAHALRREHRTQ